MSAAPEADPFKREMLSCLPGLRGFAISLIGRHDRADDLVQDTIVKAWSNKEKFEPGTNMKAWLFTILRNEFYSQMRKKAVKSKIQMVFLRILFPPMPRNKARWICRISKKR